MFVFNHFNLLLDFAVDFDFVRFHSLHFVDWFCVDTFSIVAKLPFDGLTVGLCNIVIRLCFVSSLGFLEIFCSEDPSEVWVCFAGQIDPRLGV